jgi:hypothetical protein
MNTSAPGTEPASVTTSGPTRLSNFTIAGHGAREVSVAVELQERS